MPGYAKGHESGLRVTSLGDYEDSCIVYITEKLAREHVQNATSGLFAAPACSGLPAGFISTCFSSSMVLQM